MESADTWADDEMDPEIRAELDVVIAESLAESEAGLGIPLEKALAAIRAKRAARASR